MLCLSVGTATSIRRIFVSRLQAFAGFARATENVDEFVLDEFFNVCSCGFEIFSRIEFGGIIVIELSDRSGHCKTEVGVDIDFANREFCGFAELFFGNADSVGHFAAVVVDHLNVILRNGRRTVENDGEVRQSSAYVFEDIEAESGRNENAVGISRALIGFELVCAVRRSDSDSKRVYAGSANEFFDFFGSGVRTYGVANLVFDSGKSAEFAFNGNVVSVSVFYDLSGNFDVFFERESRAVDHNGREAAVDASLASLEIGTVVEVKSDRNVGAFENGSLNELYEVGVVCVSARALGYLKNNGSLGFFASFGYTLNDFHIVYVERADCIVILIGLFEHLFGCY